MNSELNNSYKKNISIKSIEKNEEDAYIKQNFYDYLFQQFKYDKNNITENSLKTHTSIDEPRGAFSIPNDKLHIFNNKYYNTLEKLKDCSDENKLHLCELHENLDYSPILIDLDLKMDLNNDRKYDIEFIKNIVKLYNNIIKDIVILEDNDYLAYILEKEKPVLNKQGTCLKDGIHIIYPKIVTTPEVQYYIREQVLKDKSLLIDIFKNIPYTNTFSDIFDRAVISDAGWQLYGSCKPGNYSYELKYIIDKDYNLNTNTELTLDLINLLSIRYNKNKNLLKLDNIKFTQDLKKLETNIIKKDKNKDKNIKKHSCITEHNIFGRSANYNDLYDFIIPCHNLLLNNTKIQNNYSDWIKYGWILNNIHNVKSIDTLEPDNILLDKWIEISKKSTSFVEGECEKRWNEMRCKDITPGSLFMLAREYNYTEYTNITRKKLIDKQIEKICKSKAGYDSDIVDLIYIIKNGVDLSDFDTNIEPNIDEMSLIVGNKKDSLWYYYHQKQHRWIEDDEGGHILEKTLPREIEKIFREYKIKEETAAKDEEDDDFKKQYHDSRAATLNKCIKKCKDLSGNKSVMGMAKTKFTIDRKLFFKIKDQNPYLINFLNGVYDLKNLEFRNGRRSDLVTKTTNIEYKTFDMDSIEILTIKRFLETILPEEDVREYALTILGSCISGDIRTETFHIFTGGGGNGKSKLLDMVSAVLGDLYSVVDVSALTTKRGGSTQADPQLAGTKDVRLVLFQEVEKDQIVNTSKLKEWTGGDEVVARGLYKEPIKFKPQFKCIMTANNLPAFDSYDDGTWRRVKIIPFKTRFVNHKDFDDRKSISNLCKDFQGKEQRPIEYHCRKDNDLIEQVKEYKEAFMFYLLEYYKKYHKQMQDGTNIHEPWPVIEITEKIKAENNIIKDYVDTAIEFELDYEGEFSDEVWSHFKEYYNESGSDKKRCPKKKEFLVEFIKQYEKLLNYYGETMDPSVQNIQNVKNSSIIPFIKFYVKPQKKKKTKIPEAEYYESDKEDDFVLIQD